MAASHSLSVAIVTTSRADFGHIVWPLKAMQAHPDIEPIVVAIGSHLSPEFGNTVNDVRSQDVHVDHSIETLMSSDTDVGMAKTIGISVLGLADLFGKLRPDLVFVVADRYEMLSVAAVALALRIPIAHLEGGEVSEGAIDDAVRNALTKLSHIHFTPHELAAKRVIAMGEEPWRVHVSGAPSLDHLNHNEKITTEALQERLGLTLSPSVGVVSYHPVTLSEDTVSEARSLFDALSKISGQKIFCFPNCDAGSRQLIDMAEKFCADNDDAHLFVNLEHWLYWNVLFHSQYMLGNSSSALMEAPSIPLPVVNVGDRQKGRLTAKNVISCQAHSPAIIEAVSKARSPEFQESIKGMKNPYGDGASGELICRVLGELPERRILLHKKPVVLQE